MTEADFLHAICRNPFDIAARLCFADWLDERDDPRGEFIRTQVEFSRTICHQPLEEGEVRTAESLFCNDSLCRHCELDRRAGDFLYGEISGLERPSAARFWIGDLIGLVPEDERWTDHLTFRNGAVESAVTTCAQWERCGKDVVLSQPILEMELTDVSYVQILARDNWIAATGPDISPPWELTRQFHATKDDARRDVSRCAVNWARSEAGLPLLDFEARRIVEADVA